MLGKESFDGLTFLDIGSGSGLFSLAAVRLGSKRVHSLDFDSESVATTARLRSRFGNAANWTVERASVLDKDHMSSLGKWDVVYAWGVLHHTGDLWRAFENACACVTPGGRLFISVYNDQGWPSRVWKRLKRLYNALPKRLRRPYAVLVMLPIEFRSLARQTGKLKPQEYFRAWGARGERERGMSRWHDLLDWVGGYPFEVASPEEVFEFGAARGFELRALRTVGGSHGCNEFVFELARHARGVHAK